MWTRCSTVQNGGWGVVEIRDVEHGRGVRVETGRQNGRGGFLPVPLRGRVPNPEENTDTETPQDTRVCLGVNS